MFDLWVVAFVEILALFSFVFLQELLINLLTSSDSNKRDCVLLLSCVTKLIKLSATQDLLLQTHTWLKNVCTEQEISKSKNRKLCERYIFEEFWLGYGEISLQ